MPFFTEPTGYHKTALSDLQGGWQNLRDAVVEYHPFPEWQRLLFLIDEGMSWESVRDLKQMRKILLLVSNLVAPVEVSEPVREWASEVKNGLDEVFEALTAGEIS